ncbi:MAG: phospholipid carrier-dependent glycosyltransferase, partial [Chloroflexi bacterium]
MATKTRHRKPKPGPVETTVQEPLARPAPLPWLTVEVALVGLVVVLAVALRLWKLAAYPLSDAEAGQSLSALALYRGDPLPDTPYSPLMTTLAAAAFLLFGDSTFAVRLGPAVLGVLLALLPLTLRRRLGRRAALIAAFLLALSPTALYLSRTVNAEIGAAAGALMAVTGFFNWMDDHRPRWLYLLAGGLALLVTAGPTALTILLVFAVYLAWQRRALAGWLSAPPAAAPTGDGSGPDSGPQAVPWSRFALFGAGLAVVLATSGGFNPSGLAQLPGFAGAWLARFGWQTLPRAGFNAAFLLAVYEPLVVVAGLIGLTDALLNRDRFRLGLVLWLVIAFLADLLMGGRPQGHV